MPATTTFDLDTLRRAHVTRDAALVTTLFTDDAAVQVVDANHPPGEPLRLSGRDAVADLWQQMFDRDMTHDLPNVVLTDDGLAYSIACRYASGEQVLAQALCELRDGKIARATYVQAWDG